MLIKTDLPRKLSLSISVLSHALLIYMVKTFICLVELFKEDDYTAYPEFEIS